MGVATIGNALATWLKLTRTNSTRPASAARIAPQIVRLRVSGGCGRDGEDGAGVGASGEGGGRCSVGGDIYGLEYTSKMTPAA